MTAIEAFRAALGAEHVVTDAGAMAPYLTDWTGSHTGSALAVLRPGSTEEVSALVRIAAEHRVPLVPQGGNTGVSGGATPTRDGTAAVVSTARMTRIRGIDPAARTTTAEAGLILEVLQTATAEHGLDFPVMFGARGTAQLGGVLATNAGGSNVLRYGTTRDLCLGIEAVLPDGTVINTLSGLRKDNTGYDLRHLLIGSEGTLGIITAATLRLVPTPQARATAFLALDSLGDALDILNRVQDASGGLVEAFEWMSRAMLEAIFASHPGLRAPLSPLPAHGVLVELASARPDDAMPDDAGRTALEAILLETIGAAMEDGLVADGFFATTLAQRQALWSVREAVLPAILANGEMLEYDAALPLSAFPGFIAEADGIAAAHGFRALNVAHLGDGNVHYTVVMPEGGPIDPARAAPYTDALMAALADAGGSHCAEHGIGRGKTGIQVKWKDPAAQAAMARIKSALDPQGVMNPGVLFP